MNHGMRRDSTLRLMVSGIMFLLAIHAPGVPTVSESATSVLLQTDTMQPTDPESLIYEYEMRLTTAEKLSDEEALNALLSDDFLGVNQMGMRVDKKAFIGGLCADGFRFESLEIEDLNIRFAGQTVIVIGRSIYNAVVGEQTFGGTAQFIDTWVVEDGQWKLFTVSVTPERTR